MQSTPAVIIGGGQAGLAMSASLQNQSIDHVVLERSEVANSWLTERWDSLRLLTPNWMTRLPGYSYKGADPDGYMRSSEVAQFLTDYAAAINAPIRTGVEVSSVTSNGNSHIVSTNQGPIRTHAVVVATGACSTPKIPAIAKDMPTHLRQMPAIAYRNPQSTEGPVLVVGASASGMQIADELSRVGIEVTLAVGEHTRLPRTYRGMDIHWWMDTLGLLDDRYDEVEDIARARRLPSLQLVGTPEKRSLDLNSVGETGVQIVGRIVGMNGNTAQFSGGLANHCASADLKLGRLLKSIDEHVSDHGLEAELDAASRPLPTNIDSAKTTVDLASYKTVIWATGFKPNFPWLNDDLLDNKGAIRHDGGVMTQPGMYVLGMPFTRRRKSSFLDGVGPDALELAPHLHKHLDTTASVNH